MRSFALTIQFQYLAAPARKAHAEPTLHTLVNAALVRQLPPTLLRHAAGTRPRVVPASCPRRACVVPASCLARIVHGKVCRSMSGGAIVGGTG
jgi:hypothetical protein